MSRGKIASDRYLGYALTLVPLKPRFHTVEKEISRSALLGPRSNEKKSIGSCARCQRDSLRFFPIISSACIKSSRPPIVPFRYSTDRINDRFQSRDRRIDGTWTRINPRDIRISIYRPISTVIKRKVDAIEKSCCRHFQHRYPRSSSRSIVIGVARWILRDERYR